ncbi:Hypothetical protein, putative [Bodo saltans]|uniref:Uncharacterized protein n=1 Tax=Bodo saltans TaxID=75058 RepID=A0A0S4JRG0_BODSA|nr:Hypothetical protein, putative [Bodo saltans]|eukprot:CUG91967.1 Hypothetical protein, putative [Bodo saltans]
MSRGGGLPRDFVDPISRGLAEQSIILRRSLASLSAPSIHKLRSFIFSKVLEDTSAESQPSPSRRTTRNHHGDVAPTAAVMRSPLASCNAFLQLCQTFFLSPMDAFRSASMDPSLAPYVSDSLTSSPVTNTVSSFTTSSQEQVIEFFLRCIQGELLVAARSEQLSTDITFPLSVECAILLCSLIGYYQQSQPPMGTEGLELLRQVFAQCVEDEVAAEEEIRLNQTLTTDDSPLGSPRSIRRGEVGSTKISWTTLKQRLASFFTSHSTGSGTNATHHQKPHSSQQNEMVGSELAAVLSAALGTPVDASALLMKRRRESEGALSPARHPQDEENDNRVSFDEFLNHLRNDTFASGPDRARWRRRLIGSPSDDVSLSPSSPTQQPLLSSLLGAALAVEENHRRDIAVFDINERILNADPIADMLLATNFVDDNAMQDEDLYEEDSFAAESSRSQSLASFTAVFELTGPQVPNDPAYQKLQAAPSGLFGSSITNAPISNQGALTTSPTLGTADASSFVMKIGRGGVSIVPPPTPKVAQPQHLDLGSSILGGGGGPQMSASFAPTSVDESLTSAKKLQAARRKSAKKSPSSQPLGFSSSPLDHLRAKIDASVSKVSGIRATTDAKMERCARYVKKDLAVLDGHTGIASAANSASIAENSRRQPRQTHAYAPSMTEREETKLKKMLDDYNVDREIQVLEAKRAADTRERERRAKALKSRRQKAEAARHDEETTRVHSLISHEEALVRSIAACMNLSNGNQAIASLDNPVEQRRRSGHNHQQTKERHEAQRKSMHALHLLKAKRYNNNDDVDASLLSQARSSIDSRVDDSTSSRSSSSSSLSSTSTTSKNGVTRHRQHRPLPTPTPGPGETPKQRRRDGRSSAPLLNMSLSPPRARTDDQTSGTVALRDLRASSPSGLPPGSYELLVEADGIGVMRCAITYVFSFADLLEALDDIFLPFQHDLKKHHNRKRASLRGAGRRDTVMNLSLSSERRRVSDVFLQVPADSVGVKMKYIPLGAVEELSKRAKVRVLFE